MRPPAPSTATPPVPVRLQTRRWGEPRWEDRGPAAVPAGVVRSGRTSFVHDGVEYTVEDVFDDGREVTVWARVTGPPRGAR